MLLCVLLGVVSLLLLLLYLHTACWRSHALSADMPLSLGPCTSLLVSQSLQYQSHRVGTGLCRCADSGTDLEACPHLISMLVQSAEIAQWQCLGPRREALELHARSEPLD